MGQNRGRGVNERNEEYRAERGGQEFGGRLKSREAQVVFSGPRRRAVAEWDHARWRARFSDSVTNGMSSGTKQKKELRS